MTDKSIAKRPPHLPHGRWLGDFEPLNDAEKKLLADCAAGEYCTLNNGKRPKTAGDEYTIRAALIRFLVLGGDAAHPVHEKGVQLEGAWIIGALDLEGVKTEANLFLADCHFVSPLTAIGARLAGLYLNGSTVPGIIADGMVVKGAVFLSDGFTAHGEVKLFGAQIGGVLDCSDATFQNCDKDGNAVGDALSAEGMVVTGGVILREGKFTGAIDLATAHIGTLVDDANCWPAKGNIFDGLRYDRIIGPTDAATRIDWLNRQRADQLGTDFKPQPWEQLIKVLREMGHPAEAAEIAIAKQVALRKAGKIGNAKQPLRQWLLYWPLHKLYGTLAGYGYRPLRLVGWMAMLWGIASLCFFHGANQGYMGPSTALLNSPEIAAQIDAKCGHHDEPGKQYWTRCAAMPAEYTTFQPVLYALDLILPLVDLQQESDWGPIVESAPGVNMGYGVFLRWLMWATILFGWMASLMLVAILGRLVDKD